MDTELHATWAHEMRNTVGAMRLWTQILRRDPTHPAALEALTASISIQESLLAQLTDDPVRPASEPREEVSTPAVLTDISVLLIEDDCELREGLTALMTQLGASVTAVKTVAAGLEQVRSEPDVIISDIRLTDGLGLDFVRELRRRPLEGKRPIPAIALTAAGAPQDREASLHAGFEMHLVKPPRLEELLTAIVSVTADRRPAPTHV